MVPTIGTRIFVLSLTGLCIASLAWAHITPPVVLMTERQAVVAMLEGASSYSVREVRLSPEQRQTLRERWGWQPAEDFHRFYLGRDAQEQLVGTAVFMTDFTIHGPVRVAVGITPDGTIGKAAVMEMTQETHKWVKALVERQFADRYIGQGLGDFDPSAGMEDADLTSMSRFYAEVIANLIRKGLALYDVGTA